MGFYFFRSGGCNHRFGLITLVVHGTTDYAQSTVDGVDGVEINFSFTLPFLGPLFFLLLVLTLD